MIVGLKPYPAMKDSGVPWLGEVPEHWCVVQLGRKGRFSKGNGGTKEDEVTDGVPCIRYGDIYMHHKFFIRQSRSYITHERADDYTPIRYGDVLFAGSSETIEEIGKSAVNLIESGARCGGDIIIFRPSVDVDPQFMGYATDCPQSAYQKSCMGRGITVMHIYGDRLKYMWITFPPVSEQAAIVRFLDHADGRIRRYILAKQKLIKLLEEQKQAIIHCAVTRGLDPNVRLKPSGVEWLGDVPEHWNVLPIKRLFVSMDYGISESAIDVGTIRLLTMGNIADGRVTIPKTGGVTAVDASLLLEAGELLFNRTNSAELVGKVGLFAGADSPVTFASYLVRMRPRAEHKPEYLNTVLNDTAMLSMVRREAIPSLHQSNLNPTRYGRLKIALPSLDEQCAILQELISVTSCLGYAIRGAQREISLLQEYRTRLIADVVTGKLDVREAAAQLPEGEESQEAVDALVSEADSEEESGELEALEE